MPANTPLPTHHHPPTWLAGAQPRAWYTWLGYARLRRIALLAGLLFGQAFGFASRAFAHPGNAVQHASWYAVLSHLVIPAGVILSLVTGLVVGHAWLRNQHRR